MATLQSALKELSERFSRLGLPVEDPSTTADGSDASEADVDSESIEQDETKNPLIRARMTEWEKKIAALRHKNVRLRVKSSFWIASETDKLCPLCQSLVDGIVWICSKDLSELWSAKPEDARGSAAEDDHGQRVLFEELGRAMDWERKGCDLCRLIFDILANDPYIQNDFGLPQQIESTRYELHACSSKASRRDSYVATDAMLERVTLEIQHEQLGLGTLSTLVFQSFPENGMEAQNQQIRLLAPTVDYDIIRHWLSTSQSKDSATCHIPIHSADLSKPDECSPALNSITNQASSTNRGTSRTKRLPPSMRVIDCRTREIVKLQSGQKYCALSYLWGPLTSQGSTSSLQESPQIMPQAASNVIEDALRVTKELGISFLWVDRYCINQQDEADKHSQISNMHLVYGNAELTIIAAAGIDPNYGLPGVGSRKRKVENWAAFGSTRLSATWPHPRPVIKSSKWMSRGWTYQEAVFSKRRLFFTDLQVYFECPSMSCQESEVPIRGASWNNVFYGLESTSMAAFIQHIQNYAKRDLTFDSDRLNGMMGILQEFRDSPNPILHAWGLPVSIKPGDTSFARSLLHFKQVPSRRLEQFPSWSWTGWTGPWDRKGINNCFFPEEADLNIMLELKNGTLLNIQQADPEDLKTILVPASYKRLSPFIHITAWMFRLRFQHHIFPSVASETNRKHALYASKGTEFKHKKTINKVAKRRTPGFCCCVSNTCNTQIQRYYELLLDEGLDGRNDLRRRLESEIWDCIVLGSSNRSKRPSIEDSALLVLDWKDGYAERIGFIKFGNSPLWEAVADPGVDISCSTLAVPERRTVRLG